MNAITKAINDVYYAIPKEILTIAFRDNNAPPNPSLDDAILSRVIRPRVLVDCNLVGGVTQYIDLNKCGIYNYSQGVNLEYVIDVPKQLTAGRSIISPIGIFMAIPHVGGAANLSSHDGPIANQLGNVMAAAAPATAIGTGRLELIGENMILVQDPITTIFGGSIKCSVENSENLSNIPPRGYIAFGKLVVHAVKAYIHTNLIVQLGKGYISQGHELGIVNDLINDYSSANEDYQQYLEEVWLKVAYHSDKRRLASYLSGSV